jgi:hypothetical protein
MKDTKSKPFGQAVKSMREKQSKTQYFWWMGAYGDTSVTDTRVAVGGIESIFCSIIDLALLL